MKTIFRLIPIIMILASCSEQNSKSDAYGNFEATEIIVSSEVAGKVLNLTLNDGDELIDKQIVGYIDTVQLSLKRDQVNAQKNSVSTKISGILAQIDVLNEQKKNIEVEKERVEKLLKDGAATQKQLDDITGGINVINSQMNSIKTQNSTVLSELEVLNVQIDQINDQIKKSYIKSPINGTVVEKYIEESEVATPGKNLFKIADLSKIELKAYVSGDQIGAIKLGQKVKVIFDKNKDENTETEGIVSWIASQAEFTPKIIQTKEERVNLVYAVKISVMNDGSIKIGMPGEVVFN